MTHTALHPRSVGSRLPARYLLLIAAATLAGLVFSEASALINDRIVAAMLTLILAIPFVLAFCRNPANERPGS